MEDWFYRYIFAPETNKNNEKTNVNIGVLIKGCANGNGINFVGQMASREWYCSSQPIGSNK